MIYHKYKIFISQYPIIIDMYGDVYDYTKFKDIFADKTDFFEINDCIHVCFKPKKLPEYKYTNIHPNDYPFIIQGIEIVSDLIKEHSQYRDTLIVFNEAIFSLCDFQEEGLIAATIEWAAKAFKFEYPKIEVAFDKATNKYLYNFEAYIKNRINCELS
ncbi:MAG: hypothetical protein ACI4M3_04815 [Acutalibacteraceae bacterium]